MFNILIYVHEPSGYGDWTSPYYFASELVPETDKYIVKGSVQKGKQTYYLTDYSVLDHKNELARLYVPVGTHAKDSGLNLI
jgi:hypothetical protein